MNNNNNEENCTCSSWLNEIYQKYKYRVSGKIAIGLACTAGLGAIMTGIDILQIPANIFIGLTNAGAFCTGLALEKFSKENKKLNDDNESLQNEKQDIIRRFTIAPQFIPFNANTPSNASASTQVEDEDIIDFSTIYKNGVLNPAFLSQTTEPINTAS